MLRFLGHQQKCGGLGKRMAAKKGFRTSSLCRSYNDDEQPRSLSGDQKKPRKPRLQKTGGKKFKATSTVAVAVKGGGERESSVNFFSVSFSILVVVECSRIWRSLFIEIFCYWWKKLPLLKAKAFVKPFFNDSKHTKKIVFGTLMNENQILFDDLIKKNVQSACVVKCFCLIFTERLLFYPRLHSSAAVPNRKIQRESPKFGKET